MAKMNKVDLAFYQGALIGLQHIAGHDYGTCYRELVRDIDAEKLIEAAKQEEALEWSGLIKYGYCDRNGNYTPDKVCA